MGIDRREFILAALAGLAGLALAGCQTEEKPIKVDFSKRIETSPHRSEKSLTYACLPQYAHSVTYERHRLLLDYLRRTTGLSIRQIFPDTFEEHMRLVRDGKIDFFFCNPFIYIKLAKNGAQAVARIIEASGRPDFRGQIICRADNHSINDLQDCRGKRWIAVDPTSAGGYLFPLGHFLDAGINLNDFAEVSFAPGPGGKQEKVVMAVYAGRFDVGSIREDTLEVLRGKIDIDRIKILSVTRAYPGWGFAVRGGLDPELTGKLAKALTSLDRGLPDDAEILAKAGFYGIMPAQDSDYNPVRELVQKIGYEVLGY